MRYRSRLKCSKSEVVTEQRMRTFFLPEYRRFFWHLGLITISRRFDGFLGMIARMGCWLDGYHDALMVPSWRAGVGARVDEG